MTGYQYDAEGNRVGKGIITSMSCDLTTNGYRPTNDYVVDESGAAVTELVTAEWGAEVWQHTNVGAAGMLIATYDPEGLHFFFNDLLGTRRAQTDYASVPEQTCTGLAFGDQINCSMSLSAPTENHFTGLEHDGETGLDHAMFREYAANTGRWLSPDPYDGSFDLWNPQSLNRYSYGANNPLQYIDPTGLDTVVIPCGPDSGATLCVSSTIDGGGGASSIPIIGDIIGLGIDVAKIFGFFEHPTLTASHNPRPQLRRRLSGGSSDPNPLGLPAPSKTLDPDQARRLALAQGVNKGAGALNNPNTSACFYGASVLAAGAVLTAGPSATLARAYAPEIGNAVRGFANFVTNGLADCSGSYFRSSGRCSRRAWYGNS